MAVYMIIERHKFKVGPSSSKYGHQR